ncbi:winged helix DNA-binding domain-containing protein [Rhizophagus clarus]|uniref:Winged helix DNA-binding domain-containing protein n=1 Tax=Rhizophagus clarus TaxID=94130 RepID=A0A8H3R3E2_9GLOM|nr:winged helix DNA-binding domain-containing protein [Rhizophagus clarus]
MTTTTERIRNPLNNHHMMPSQSNDMLSYEVYNNDNSHVTCSEGEPLFQEETGKYDLDTVSVFVAKLYQLLDCDDYKEYLTWNETGDVFVICNMDEFAQNVLPKYFKHCKFTSFVRQLNIYGFYRVSDARKSKHVRSKHACVFSHSQFRRGRQDLLPNIRRKVSKTVRRKPRNTDSTLSQNHVGDGSSSSQSIYGSSSLIKSGNMNKDLNRSNNSVHVYQDSKDFLLGSDRSDDTIMRERIADLTATTENLRKDLKQISSIVNDNLLPEVRNLAEGLHKHQEHLIALTQLVTCAFPDGVQLLHDVTRGYTRHMPYEIPKRVRLDDKPTVKTEQTSSVPSVPTVPSSRVPPSYNLFTPNSSNHNHNNNNNLMNSNNPSPTESSLQTSSVTPSALTIPSDSQSSFNNIAGSSIMGEYQQSPHNTQSNITGFNESWNSTTSVMISDPVSTVSSTNMSYNIFPTTTTTQSPILYSPSPNQQHSPPLSHNSQVPSRSSSIALSPANSNSNDILNNAPTVTSPTQINASVCQHSIIQIPLCQWICIINLIGRINKAIRTRGPYPSEYTYKY